MHEVVEMKKKFAIWTVGGEEYKLKLPTSAIITLEEQYGCNLLKLAQTAPKLKDMMKITYHAMRPYKPKLKETEVYELFDQYVDEGGSQTDFTTDVFFEIYKVSGFFSEKQAEVIDVGMEKRTAAMEEQIAKLKELE